MKKIILATLMLLISCPVFAGNHIITEPVSQPYQSVEWECIHNGTTTKGIVPFVADTQINLVDISNLPQGSYEYRARYITSTGLVTAWSESVILINIIPSIGVGNITK